MPAPDTTLPNVSPGSRSNFFNRTRFPNQVQANKILFALLILGLITDDPMLVVGVPLIAIASIFFQSHPLNTYQSTQRQLTA